MTDRRIRIAAWALALALASGQAWMGRHDLFPDSVSYLDIGDAYLHGDLRNAINGSWSPLYAILLGITNYLVQPSPAQMFAAARITNLVIFACTLAAFEWFITTLLAVRQAITNVADETLWPWLVFFYGVFFWSSFSLLTVSRLTPDMCVAALVYTLAGLIVSMRSRVWGRLKFFLFGVTLGVAYLAKTAMFPIALIFLAMAFLMMREKRNGTTRTLVAVTGFLAIAIPFIVLLSHSKGRLTIGDAGVFNYTMAMNDIHALTHWQKDVVTGNALKHPTRKLLERPAVFEFATPVAGTYPPWTEPYYWFEGMRIRFSITRQLVVIATSVWVYWFVLTPLLLGAIVAATLATERFWKVGGIFSHWPFIIPAIAALSMYALVHVESRYIAPFIVILWIGIFTGARLALEPAAVKVMRGVLVGTALLLLVPLGAETADKLAAELRGEDTASMSLVRRTADSLERAGVEPGTRVATIAGLMQSYWARMLGLRIIAEVPFDQRAVFWFGGADGQRRVLSVFRETGAAIVVAENVPPFADTSGWRHVEGTDAWWIDLRDSAVLRNSSS